MQRKASLSLAMLFCITAVVQAGTVVVGTHVLQPNMAGQMIQLTVSGIATGDPTGLTPNSVSGMIFAVAIEGGGPAYGGSVGPKITGIDVDAGPSIWVPPNTAAGHSPPNQYFDPGGQFAFTDLVTNSGFVNVNSGIFVTLTIDTTGMIGLWSLQLIGNGVDDAIAQLTGPTDFLYGNGGGLSTITDGIIWAGPEPSSVVLGLSALAGFVAVVYRKRRARRV